MNRIESILIENVEKYELSFVIRVCPLGAPDFRQQADHHQRRMVPRMKKNVGHVE